jgi:hypothetical protein
MPKNMKQLIERARVALDESDLEQAFWFQHVLVRWHRPQVILLPKPVC